MNNEFKIQRFSIFSPQSSIKNKGFTLMELMVVIAIIVLLAGIMVPNLANRIERAKVTKAEADISAIESAIAMYETDTGRYPPDSITELSNWLTGQNVDTTSSSAKDWHGPYIKGIEDDPWGTPYRYINVVDSGSYDLYYDTPNDCEGIADGAGGCVAPPTPDLNYYIYSLGKNRSTGDAYDDDPTDGDNNDDDINNWDVDKSWREAY
jgi:general secretion pathway protein G